VRRRAFLGVLTAVAAWPLAAAAQQGSNKKRFAIFSPSERSADWHDHSGMKYAEALFGELRRLRYVEGQNLAVESYGREQNTSGLEALATDVVRGNPDVVLVNGPGALVFKKLTSRLSIVTISADPVRQGLAESLAHPGGMITGASIDPGPSIHGKRIALLREMFPAIAKLGYLALRIQDAFIKGAPAPAAAEAAGLPIAVSLLEIGSTEKDWRAAIESLARDGANAVIVVDSPETFQSGAVIARLLAEANLPAMFSFTESVEAGGLMAYSFDLTELYRRAANDIDAILRGAKPGDIPFYQATKFELSINLKTAKQLGLSVPPALLASADEVIE
jgi:putative ABC transport system substrate-binding protein